MQILDIFFLMIFVMGNVSVAQLLAMTTDAALLNLSSWCLVMVERLFIAVPRGCLRFVIVVFPDHTHLLFFRQC